MNSERPVIHDLERTGADVTLEVLAYLGVFLLVGISAYYYPRLPETIPQHFNLKGEPDGWGGKGSLLIMPIIGVILFTLLTVLSQFPHVFNYPWPITEANARRQYAISRQMLSAVKLALVATFTYITWSMIGTALGRRDGLGPSFMIVETSLLFAIIGFYLVRAKRAQ
jgi:uncharacterized membrane protein